MSKEQRLLAASLARDHPEGTGKAEFFTRFGCTLSSWKVLAEALLTHARTYSVVSTSLIRYGAKYRIEGAMLCPDGRASSVRTVWIVDTGSDKPRLVTAYPI